MCSLFEGGMVFWDSVLINFYFLIFVYDGLKLAAGSLKCLGGVLPWIVKQVHITAYRLVTLKIF